MEEERSTTSDCFTYGVPTYDFVSGKDGAFPEVPFSAVRCKPLKADSSLASWFLEEAWDMTGCTVKAQKANKRIHG